MEPQQAIVYLIIATVAVLLFELAKRYREKVAHTKIMAMTRSEIRYARLKDLPKEDRDGYIRWMQYIDAAHDTRNELMVQTAITGIFFSKKLSTEKKEELAGIFFDKTRQKGVLIKKPLGCQIWHEFAREHKLLIA